MYTLVYVFTSYYYYSCYYFFITTTLCLFGYYYYNYYGRHFLYHNKKIEEIRSLLPAYVHIMALAAVEKLSVFRLLFVACAEETTAG